MPDTPSFVVNDRRKFTSEGELRHEPSTAGDSSNHSAAAAPVSPESQSGPQLVASGPGNAPAAELTESTDLPESAVVPAEDAAENDDALQLADDVLNDSDSFSAESLPPGPTEEQNAEANRAYQATVERLDLAMRAADPGGERVPAMSFERLTQSLYTQALMLLGGAAQPGETPRVDILGARQTIDMLTIVAEKSKGNLSPDEDKLLQSALFDLRMGFLEITQALARQAQQRQPAGGPGGMPPMGAGPRIVR